MPHNKTAPRELRGAVEYYCGSVSVLLRICAADCVFVAVPVPRIAASEGQAGADIDAILALQAYLPFAAAKFVSIREGINRALRTRPIDRRLHVRSADAAEAVAQGSVATGGVNHLVPLVLAGKFPCAAGYRRSVGGAGGDGRAPVHLAFIGQRECQDVGVINVANHGHCGHAAGQVGVIVVLAIVADYLSQVGVAGTCRVWRRPRHVVHLHLELLLADDVIVVEHAGMEPERPIKVVA